MKKAQSSDRYAKIVGIRRNAPAIISGLLCLFLFAPITAAAPVDETEPPLWQVALVPQHTFAEPELPMSAETASEKAKTGSGDLEQLILQYFPDAPVMARVGASESTGTIGQFDPGARNPKSTASGLFQITDPTWKDTGCEGSKTNALDSIICARKLYDSRGLSPWASSKYLWD